MQLASVTGRVARTSRGFLPTYQSYTIAKKWFASSAPSIPPVVARNRSHRIVVIGGGSAGCSVSHQLLRSGKYNKGDIAIVDPAEWHHYQPGWTLVGGGLADKDDFKLRMADLCDPKLTVYGEKVRDMKPEENLVVLENGEKLEYGQLIVCPGIKSNYGHVPGLQEALADAESRVYSIYSYNYCGKVFPGIQQFRSGTAIFTQPLGMLKCAGAPQKLMWLALDYWKRAGLYTGTDRSSPINISFMTGLPVMFGVPKYSAKLMQLAQERGIRALFQHDLVEISGDSATFALPDGSHTTEKFDFLHATPKMGPHDFVARSSLADAAGLVAVDPATLRHTMYNNVWAIGDASNLPTSKTAAAITAQAPVLVSNLHSVVEGKPLQATYDGYTSCPLITEYGKVLLAEFQYGAEPKETFAKLGVDQIEPRRLFYHLKKDFFPFVYRKFMVKGSWAGPKGFIR